jgi:hypothetical protein
MRSEADLQSHYAAVRARITRPITTNITKSIKLPVVAVPEPEPAPEPIRWMDGAPPMAKEIALSVKYILQAYGFTWREAFASRRDNVSRHRNARAAIFWLLHCRGWSYPKIGKLCGRDHTTVIWSLFRLNIWGATKKDINSARRLALYVKYHGREP